MKAERRQPAACSGWTFSYFLEIIMKIVHGTNWIYKLKGLRCVYGLPIWPNLLGLGPTNQKPINGYAFFQKSVDSHRHSCSWHLCCCHQQWRRLRTLTAKPSHTTHCLSILLHHPLHLIQMAPLQCRRRRPYFIRPLQMLNAAVSLLQPFFLFFLN